MEGRLAKRKEMYDQFMSSVNSEEQGCSCPPRIVDSFTLTDYLALQEDLQALAVRDALQHDADSQLLLSARCSPNPAPKDAEAEGDKN